MRRGATKEKKKSWLSRLMNRQWFARKGNEIDFDSLLFFLSLSLSRKIVTKVFLWENKNWNWKCISKEVECHPQQRTNMSHERQGQQQSLYLNSRRGWGPRRTENFFFFCLSRQKNNISHLLFMKQLLRLFFPPFSSELQKQLGETPFHLFFSSFWRDDE